MLFYLTNRKSLILPSKAMVKGICSVAYLSLRSMIRQEKSDLRCLMIYESIMNFLGGVVVFSLSHNYS